MNAWTAVRSVLATSGGDVAAALDDVRRCDARAAVIEPPCPAAPPLVPRPPLLLLAVRLAASCEDFTAALGVRPDAILLTDCRGLADVDRAAARLAVAEAEHGLDDGSTGIVASVADGVEGLAALAGGGSFAAAVPRLRALTWDAGRLAAAAGGGADFFILVRALVLAAARTADVAALAPDGPEDAADYGASCRALKACGFAGRITRDAARAEAINRAFAP